MNTTVLTSSNITSAARTFLQNTSPLLLAAHAIGLYVSYIIIYGLFLCPTRHIPGPFLTRFSGIPFALNLTSGEVSARIHQQHEKYGPVLRLAPGKLDIQLLQASQDAWAGHNTKHLPWDKEPALAASERWWLKVDNVVSMKRAKDALKMRRIMGKPFARKFLQDQEDIFKEGTIKFLDRVETLRKAHECKIDIYAEFGNYAFDVLTDIVYGGYFKKAAIRPGVSFIQLIGQASAGLVLGGNFPIIAWIFERIPIKMFDWIRSGPELYKICAASIKSYKDNAKPGSRKDSLGALISSTDDDGNHLTDLQLLSNAFLLYVAGTETVSNAATFTIYELAKQPQIAARLAEELSIFKSVQEFTTVNLEHLPLLNAVIREGLRLYSPVGGPGGREAPPEGVEMGGYYIPGGVVVSRQSYSVCRDKDIYPEPLVFRPERWLGISKDQEAKMWDATMIFSHGPRICLGKEYSPVYSKAYFRMALIELRMLIAAFVMTYSWEGVPDIPGEWDDEMKAVDFMVVRPKNEKCVVQLQRRYNSG